MVHSRPHATGKGPEGVPLELTLALLALFSVVVAIPTIGAVTGASPSSSSIVVPLDAAGHAT